jgi:hypothetical protein
VDLPAETNAGHRHAACVERFRDEVEGTVAVREVTLDAIDLYGDGVVPAELAQ